MKLERALNTLWAKLQAGMDWPAAHTYACAKHGVRGEALTKLYDQREAELEARRVELEQDVSRG